MKTKPFNVGDKVTDLIRGKGTVINVNSNENVVYPIGVDFNGSCISYTRKGKYLENDYMPTLIYGWYDSISIIGRNKKVNDGSKATDNK